jgi:hypothetical protein
MDRNVDCCCGRAALVRRRRALAGQDDEPDRDLCPGAAAIISAISGNVLGMAGANGWTEIAPLTSLVVRR